jgi:hypothetical protein
MEALQTRITFNENVLNNIEHGDDEDLRNYRWVRMIKSIIDGNEMNEKKVAFTSGSITAEQIGDYHLLLKKKQCAEEELKQANFELGKLKWLMEHENLPRFEIRQLKTDDYQKNYKITFFVNKDEIELIFEIYPINPCMDYFYVYVNQCHLPWQKLTPKIQKAITDFEKEKHEIVKVFLNT